MVGWNLCRYHIDAGVRWGRIPRVDVRVGWNRCRYHIDPHARKGHSGQRRSSQPEWQSARAAVRRSSSQAGEAAAAPEEDALPEPSDDPPPPDPLLALESDVLEDELGMEAPARESVR